MKKYLLKFKKNNSNIWIIEKIFTITYDIIKKKISMKKILILLTLTLLTSCSWNYKNWDIQKNIEAEDVKQFEQELLELEQKKAKEALEKIKLENEIASEVLENFLKSEDFDIKAEIEKTKEKYNDSLGPILEYEHEKKEEVETNTGATLTGSTLSWTIIDTDNLETEENESNNETYSWEVKLVDNKQESNTDQKTVETESEAEEEVTYNTQEKKWRSWTYTMFIWLSNNCKWWLQMTDLEWNKKWLFENSCEKMIYSFELAVWGINVSYNTQDSQQKTEFVSIK